MIEYKEDLLRIQRIVLELGGQSITLTEADMAWKEMSTEMYAAGFLVLPDDDNEVWHLIRSYL